MADCVYDEQYPYRILGEWYSSAGNAFTTSEPCTVQHSNLMLPMCTFAPFQGDQPKRRRRRPEEIERLYICGWEDCVKAYGTLNHLNAHVMMQSHGKKRISKDFIKIRKEWKQRKKANQDIADAGANLKTSTDIDEKSYAPSAALVNGGAVNRTQCSAWTV